ncbi:MAG: ribonuclease III [bacterium]|nr:ribonuclease III [bacterium]
MSHLTDYTALEKKIGYVFKDQELLQKALTHSSYSNEFKSTNGEDYERLEFLGDAVLELSVSEYLFTHNPSMYEGNMTKLRASLVCEPTLAICAREIELEKYIMLGKGEEQTGGRNRDSIVSDVFESLIAAIYLDSSYEEAKEFVYRRLLADMEHRILFCDSKSILQEMMQQQGKDLVYEVVETSGPAHDRMYRVQAQINGKQVGEGNGRSKKGAEQEAAYQVLITLKDK